MQTRDEVRFLKPIPQIWNDTLNILAKTLSPGSFALLDTATELKGFNSGLAVIGVSNQFYVSLLHQSKAAIQEALLKATGVQVMIEFVVDGSVNGGNYTGTFADIEAAEPAQHQDTVYDSNGGQVADQVIAYEVSTNTSDNLSEDWVDSAEASTPVETLTSSLPETNEVADPSTNPSIDDQESIDESSVITSVNTTLTTLKPTIGAAPQFTSRPNNIVTPIIPPASHSNAQAARTSAAPQMGRIQQQPTRAQSRPNNLGTFDLTKSGLSAKHTFNTFVVGSNNRFCHSAALAVAQSPGQNYNPLFIYGGVGLGKTHLMQAIGYAILERSPDIHVRYVSGERFTNDMINSIRDKSTTEFRKRYRNVDVLLIDDIQFIEGKESTQEEFFHTFNTLRDAGKQIVLTSDRPPKAFSKLEERLKSRFEWGLTSDIQAPDYETRLAILRKKCDSDKLPVDDETLNHIATLFTTNIRELEGALIRVSAYSKMTGERIDQRTLHTILSPHGTPKAKPTLTMDAIINAVAEHYKVDSAALKSSSRSADITLPRHVAMHLAHELMNLSFPRIGEAFGNRRHTSVMHANTKVKGLLNSNPNVAAAISQIRRQLGH
ncbi:MAG: chromosomal replication initiator protein DnaA [Candidatus Melainabacteria bacterium]|nr:chromosomal replication initiator protein DnaA [Candidatus Melainabacteria bacterium]